MYGQTVMPDHGTGGNLHGFQLRTAQRRIIQDVIGVGTMCESTTRNCPALCEPGT